MATEYGWLIERERNGQIEYLFFENEAAHWTTDSLKALRFARRCDAEQLAYGEDCERVVEHGWG